MSPTSAPGGLDAFEAERPRLNGLAYRITGSLADAEDVVQEAWVRWAAEDAAAVGNPGGWLTTVTSRLALDRLRAQRRRREVYVGPWLPDPVTSRESRRLRTNVDGNPLIPGGAVLVSGGDRRPRQRGDFMVTQPHCVSRCPTGPGVPYPLPVDRLPCSSRRY